MEELTKEEIEAIELLSISELLKLHEDTNRAIIRLYERIIKGYELIEEGGEEFMAILNLSAIRAAVARIKDEAARLRVISLAARREAIKRARESD